MDDKRNCKDYCRFSKCCYTKGFIGQDPNECPTAWKIEDILNDYRAADYQTDDDEPMEDDEE